MILIWNRKEVFVGYSLEKFSKVRETLNANKIKHTYKVVDQNNKYIFGSRQARISNFGENMNYSKTYYIYVHKQDYDEACAVLRNFK